MAEKAMQKNFFFLVVLEDRLPWCTDRDSLRKHDEDMTVN
jgi:hypothetical protein